MKSVFLIVSFVIGCLLMVSMRGSNSAPLLSAAAASSMNGGLVGSVEKSDFGKTKDGHAVSLYTCKNANGLVMKLMDFGATVVSLEVPDRKGNLGNVLLTCPDIAGFETCTMYFNASVGRFANRIAKGKFKLDGKEYQLATNNGPNHLHGGIKGFDKLMWKAEPFQNPGAVGVNFSLVSADGDEGYPGTLKAKATYTLTDKNEFIIEFRANTDKPTIVNLTNHNYWNLAGSGTIEGHELKLNCSKYLPVDETAIPTGELKDVTGTPFDFKEFQPIGKRFAQVGGTPEGYDHCYVVDGEPGRLRPAATVKDPVSGRVMEISTTEPGIQFYSGNFLDGKPTSGGYAQHSAFCLETEHFPDAPNQPKFSSVLLKPGDEYFHKTVHVFKVE